MSSIVIPIRVSPENKAQLQELAADLEMDLSRLIMRLAAEAGDGYGLDLTYPVGYGPGTKWVRPDEGN